MGFATGTAAGFLVVAFLYAIPLATMVVQEPRLPLDAVLALWEHVETCMEGEPEDV